MKETIVRIQKEQAWMIRHKVMWPEKNLDFIKLNDDDSGIHYGLFLGDTLVSVVSIFITNDECQFRKFATIQQEQGKGYGSKLLNYALKEVESMGVRKIWCNARENKVKFYHKFGLVESVIKFEKAGKSYIIMEKYI